MKRLATLLFLFLLLLPHAACAFDKSTRFDFADGEYYIWIPNKYSVMHENSSKEELLKNSMYAPDGAKAFLDSYGLELFATWEDDKKTLLVTLYKDIFDEEVELEDRYTAELFIEDMIPIIENRGQHILFSDPITGEYHNFGKIASFIRDDVGITYYVDYVLLKGKDIIILSFSSENKQFSIEEGHTFDEIADRTGSYFVAAEIG